MKTDVTGVIIIHNDASLLKQSLDTVKNWVDRLIIVDGAYAWVAPFCALHGEDPERSTDDLLNIVTSSGLPFEHYAGTWESETHKRMFSLEKTKTNLVMTIDSDELFEIQEDKLRRFYDSGKVFGDCYFPLYFTPNAIGHSTGLRTPPVKPVLINKAAVTIRQIVDTMFLMVPGDERQRRLGNDTHFKEKLGTVHHISSFRQHGGAYRRARFYNLLAMRIAKSANIIGKGKFETDAEFFKIIKELGSDEMAALDSLFQFHRIAVGFPQIKDNQMLVPANSVPKDIQRSIDDSFNALLDEQHCRILENAQKGFRVFAGRPMYLDVTGFLRNDRQGFEIDSSSLTHLKIVAYYDQGLIRREVEVGASQISIGRWSIVIPQLGKDDLRCILEVTPSCRDSITDIKISPCAPTAYQ